MSHEPEAVDASEVTEEVPFDTRKLVRRVRAAQASAQSTGDPSVFSLDAPPLRTIEEDVARELQRARQRRWAVGLWSSAAVLAVVGAVLLVYGGG